MEKLTVYGLPLSPRPFIKLLKGRSFCISYATRRDLGRQLEDAIALVGKDQVLLVDNGAFSAYRKGIAMDESYIEGFEAWAQDILDRCPNAVAVIPDVIGGTVEQNVELMETSMLDSDRCMVIWHLNEPISYLLQLCERYNWIGFGSAGEYWKVGTPEWHARMREVFAAIDKWEAECEGCYVRPRIHLMRAQSMAHLYPVDSSDSCTLAVNHRRTFVEDGSHIVRYADRIDGKIQDSAGPAAEHQLKRGLLDHVEATASREFWNTVTLLERAGYRVVLDEVETPPAGSDVEEWLRQYHAIEEIGDDQLELDIAA